MKLQINGEEKTFDAPSPFTLIVLIESLGMKSDRVAIELNRDIVPRDRWVETILNEGDKLEIVHFVGGGSRAVTELRLAVAEKQNKMGSYRWNPAGAEGRQC